MVVEITAGPSSGSGVPTTRKINTTAPLTGGGDLSADRTIALTTPLTVGNGGTGTGTAFTQGSVIFAGASGIYSQNNSNLFWDNTNNRLGLGVTNPATMLVLNNGHLRILSSTPANYIDIGLTDTTATIEFFQSGIKDHLIQLSGNNTTFVSDNLVVTSGSLTVGGFFTLNSTLASTDTGVSVGTTQAGIIDLWSPSGKATFISWSEHGIANRGAMGFLAGSSALVYQPSIELLGDGTTKFSIDTSGNIAESGKTTTYNGVSTVGWGTPAVYGTGRSTAQTAAVASVATYTVGAADGSFLISANVNVTTSTTHSINVQVAYTDETNTAQTLTLNFQSLAGALLTAITNVQGTGPYEGIPVHIRAKASTAITIKTAGTFTVVTYNVEGYITQIG